MRKYVGILNFDYTGPTDANGRYLVAQALEQVGWDYAETTAFVMESPDFAPFAKALEILARAAADPGTISSLTLAVQLVDDEVSVPGARRSNPVATIKAASPGPL